MSIFKMTTLLGSLLLSACSVVYSPAPMGETPVVLDPQDWNGTWLTDDGIAVASVTDAENGKLELAFIEGMEMEAGEVLIRSSGGWMFASFIDEEEEDPASQDRNINDQPRYAWGRIELNGNTIIIWEPDVAAFRELVKSGVLPGETEERDGLTDGNVYLGDLTSEHYGIITSGSKGVLVDWEQPGILIRFPR